MRKRVQSHQWCFITFFIFIGILLIDIDVYGQMQDQGLTVENQSSAREKGVDDGLVTVEPSQLLPISRDDKFESLPYRLWRQKWGNTFSVSYSMFAPTHYKSKIHSVNFEGAHSLVKIPLIEVNVVLKRNTDLGSLGVEFGAGVYKSQFDVSGSSSLLRIYPIRLGGVFTLDNLSENPVLVPYIAGGAYIMRYTEEVPAKSADGYTQASFYIVGGIMLSLNWIDRQAAMASYLNLGIKNTYLFVEGRKFFASSADEEVRSLHFETDFHGNSGFRIEF